MNFFHNRIVNPVDQGLTFNEWLEKNFGAKEASSEEEFQKEASEAKPGLGLDDEGKEPRGQQRGQVINTDNEDGAGYQKGESVSGKDEQGGNARPDAGGETDQKKNEQVDKGGSAEDNLVCATCGKEMGECDDAGKVTEDHTEAGPGDDKHPEPKTLINNDPNYQKGESTDPGKVKGDSKKQPGDPVVGKSASGGGFKKVASLNHSEKLALFASLSANKTNLLETAGGNGPLVYVEAMVGMKFANMTEEEKDWFRNFWQILYPGEYVEQMVADR